MSDDGNGNPMFEVVGEIWVQAATGDIEPLAKLPPSAAGPEWHGLDDGALTAAHAAVEHELVELRDARISVMGPANGFVIRERDGRHSTMMRLGTRDGIAVGIIAYQECLAAKRGDDWPGLINYLLAKGWIEADG